MYIKSKITHFWHNRFVRNTATLGSGTFVGNFIQGISGIILARLLQPELFGIYSLALALASVMVIFLGLGAYEAVTTILGEAYAKKDRREIIDSLAFLIKLTVITAAIGVVGALLAPQIAGWLYGNASIGIYASIVVIALVISQIIFPISRMLFQIVGRIKSMTILGISDQVSRFGLSVIFAMLGFGILGAVSGHLVGACIVFLIAIFAWKKINQEYKIIPSLRKVVGLWKQVKMKKYLGFSIWIALDRNIAALYLMLPVILTGIFVSASDVSFFKLAFGYVNLAVSFLGPISVLLNVEFPKMKVIEAGVPEDNIIKPRSKDFDLRNLLDCQIVTKSKDIVIHLAGNVGGIGKNRDYPATMFFDNIMMGIQLMECARLENVEKFITVGTICSYPKFTDVPFKESDLWKGYPEETNAPYGLAKKMLLVQGEAYRQEHNFNAIYLLQVNLYGPGDNFDPSSSHVIPALILKVAEAKRKNKKYIEVWGTGKPTREFLYVEDAAEGIVGATKYYDKPEPINLGSGMEISIKDLVELICKIMEFDGKIKWNKNKPDGQPRRMLDVSLAKKGFGFSAKTDFEKGLRKTINWYLENHEEA